MLILRIYILKMDLNTEKNLNTEIVKDSFYSISHDPLLGSAVMWGVAVE